ncbi:hydantoinase/oxoprolinase family protein [Siccirubricoccus sp. G192]|uniref:hydantoinase/oxoprolinase family protein n=1 Tax=Siccirubricoccus sp. G192 TaxID=2849651 RepID=UPI001C2CC3EF|nr:hydantoinase/oxoprolinase family protein [Siccirubricoccus sp. G192]MBV1799919.1 hydantoinase/oxoprolinase family protein [Siccirubricoccus sp. G192]
MALSLGIDIGGTFTDLVLHDPDGLRSGTLKVLTTHADPVLGILDGTRRLLADRGVPPAAVSRVVHATTLFTNALIERKGAVTALVTTAGFRDILQIGRERRYELYDLQLVPPAPLVPRELRLEVPERVKADGTVLQPLDAAALEAQVAEAVAMGAQSVAVLFLHSDLHPAHEAAAAALIKKRFPQVSVTASHAIVREVREYERGSTASANAYVAPLAERYLARLGAELTGLGIAGPLVLMLSNGGLTHLQEAQRAPVQLLESGPAAGGLAAAFLAGPEEARVLAFDLGGTTAKLCVVEHGEPEVVFGFEAARQARFIEGSGLPIRISTVDLIEIGAGGGSIARRDAIGLLKVGPDSAGSEPGPACYGRGGQAPTVTDANLLLGYLDPARFAGGELPLDRAAAEATVARLAEALGLAPQDVAWGIHDVATEAMAGAARTHLAERGRDAAEFTLVCTGGGGPVHGCHLARKLGIRRLIVPPEAGVASALGMLAAPPRVDRVATLGRRLKEWSAADLDAAFAALEAEAREVLALGGWQDAALAPERLVDARCVGQGAHMPVPLPPTPWPVADAALHGLVAEAFHRAYQARYSRPPPAVPIDLVHARVVLRGRRKATAPTPRLGTAAGTGPERREVRFEAGTMTASVFSRAALPAGFTAAGPALVQEAGSTLVVGPAGRFTVLDSGNILVELG